MRGESRSTFLRWLSPESGSSAAQYGTINYAYDSNGNMVSRYDQRGVTTTFAYDGLNRMYHKEYSGGTAESTPSVDYLFDGIGQTGCGFCIGRLNAVKTYFPNYQ